MSAAALGVTLWPVLAPRMGCGPSAAYIAPVWLLIALAMTESAALKRRAFVGFYLSRAGLGRLLLPGPSMWILQGAKSGIFALLLMMGALSLGDGQRWLLLTDVLVLLLLRSLLERMLGAQVRRDIRLPVIGYWAHWLNALLLWLALPAAGLFSPPTDYRGVALDQALLDAAGRVSAGCDAVTVLGRLQAALTALPQWTVDNLLPGSAAAGRPLLAWLLLFVVAGVSFLFVWAYSRLLSGALARPWMPVGRKGPDDES
jgi:hypothetical protein